MMKYQQNDGVFMPKKRSVSDSPTSIKGDSGPQNEKLIQQVKEYNSKIKELEKQLEIKNTEIHSSNSLISSLREEIEKLEDMQEIVHDDIHENAQDFVNFNEIDSLKNRLNSTKKENAELEKENADLKKEIAIQNEHTQLLYVLVVILAMI